MDKGYVIFKAQEDANAFLRSNPEFRPTSMHQSWQGKIKCKHCKVAGWVKDIHANKNWSNRHGANCKKKQAWVYNNTFTFTTNTYYNTTITGSSNYTYFWQNLPTYYARITYA